MAEKKRFEQLLRPVYEARAAIVWGVASLWMIGVAFALDAPKPALAACALLALSMTGMRFLAANKLLKYKMSLLGQPTVVMPASRLQKSMHKLGSNLWLGWGYRWEPRHTQRAYEIMKRDLVDVYWLEDRGRWAGILGKLKHVDLGERQGDLPALVAAQLAGFALHRVLQPRRARQGPDSGDRRRQEISKDMTTIVTLNAARARIAPKDLRTASVVYWPVSELHEADEDEWIKTAVRDTPHESFAEVIWAHHPNLKEATRKLAEYIGPHWPDKAGGSLLALCIAEALRRSHAAVSNGEAFLGRIVGVYLFGLTEHAADVARLTISGTDLSGVTHRWTPFAEPLGAWAKRLCIDTVCAEFTSPAPSEGTIAGVRTHMVTRLANPTDTGHLLRHAANG